MPIKEISIMNRTELSLWMYAPAESMFLYYFIGAMALIFFISVFITKALSRRKSQVVELLGNEEYNEPTVTYLVAITTSLRLGAGCSDSIKVFMQLVGDRNVSPYFTLRAEKVGRPMLKRGLTDIFLVKVKESFGRISSVKLVVCGVDIHLKWKISQIQLYSPRSNRRRNLPVTVLIPETLAFSELNHVLLQPQCCSDCLVSLVLYHQWLSRIGNTVRFGAFSDIVHVLLLYTTILTPLLCSLIFYIIFPRPGVDTATFALNYTSFAISSVISASSCFFICLVLEVVIRNVRSREKDLNYAYYSLKEKKNSRHYHQTEYTSYDISKNADTNVENHMETGANSTSNIVTSAENELFVLKYSACSQGFKNSSESSHVLSQQSQSNHTKLSKAGKKKIKQSPPVYIQNLIKASLKYQHGQRKTEPAPDETLSLSLENLLTSKTQIQDKLSKSNAVGFVGESRDHKSVDAETGKGSHDKPSAAHRTESTSVQAGVRSKTSVLSHQQLVDISQSKFGSVITHRLSQYLSNVFGDDVVSKTKFKEPVEKEIESEDSLMVISFPALSSLVSAEDLADQDSERKIVLFKDESFGGDKTSKVSGRLVLDKDANDVRVEMNRDTVASFDVKLGRGGRQKERLDRKTALYGDPGVKVSKVFRRTPSEVIDLRDTEEIPEDKRNLKHVKRSRHNRSENALSEKDHKDCIELRNRSENSKSEKNYDVTDYFKEADSLTRITTSGSKFFVNKNMEKGVEDMIKTWSRSFIQTLMLKFKSYRDLTVEGSVMFQMSWDEVMDWVHEVVFKITSCLAYKLKKDVYQSDIFRRVEIQNLLGHAAAEIILLAIDGVLLLLEHEGKNSLADLILQSHYLMQGVSQAADALVYCIEEFQNEETNSDLVEMLRQLDVESDLKSVSLKFLKDCATWTYQQGALSWPLLQALVPQTDIEVENKESGIAPVEMLTTVIGPEKYNDVGFVATRLTDFVIDEAQAEVWNNFQIEQLTFTDILVKLRILEQFRKKLDAVQSKVMFLDTLISEHDKPKSRIQKRMEKRLHIEQFGESEEKQDENKSLEGKRSHSKHTWKDKIASLKYKDWVKEAKSLAKPQLVLSKLCTLLEQRWTKQGLKLHMKAETHLAQTLLQLKIDKDTEKSEGFRFENYLHFKRTESILAGHLRAAVDDLVKIVIQEAIETCLTEAASFTMVIEDVIVKADVIYQILTKTVEKIMTRVLKLEQDREQEIDKDIERKLSQQFSAEGLSVGPSAEAVIRPLEEAAVRPSEKSFVRPSVKSSARPSKKATGRPTVKAAVRPAEERSYRPSEEGSDHIIDIEPSRYWDSFKTSSDERQDFKRQWPTAEEDVERQSKNVFDINQSADLDKVMEANETQITRKNNSSGGRSTNKKTSDKEKSRQNNDFPQSAGETEEEALRSMISVLKPIKSYLAYIRREERLQTRTDLKRYFQKSERKRHNVCSLNYQRLVDSYYVVDEDENNPSHTKESLYQLEHDFMQETNKPFSGVVKTILVFLMIIWILCCFVYVGLVAGQLSTSETQEWICYYLLSLAEFGFVLEPLRAFLIGCCMKRYCCK